MEFCDVTTKTRDKIKSMWQDLLRENLSQPRMRDWTLTD